MQTLKSVRQIKHEHLKDWLRDFHPHTLQYPDSTMHALQASTSANTPHVNLTLANANTPFVVQATHYWLVFIFKLGKSLVWPTMQHNDPWNWLDTMWQQPRFEGCYNHRCWWPSYPFPFTRVFPVSASQPVLIMMHLDVWTFLNNLWSFMACGMTAVSKSVCFFLPNSSGTGSIRAATFILHTLKKGVYNCEHVQANQIALLSIQCYNLPS